MKLEMDKIKFEYRSEIDEVSEALGIFAKEHPDAKGIESIQKLEKLLETMYLSW